MINSLPYDFKNFPGSSHWLLIRAIRRTPRWHGPLLDIGAAGGELASILSGDFDTLIGIEGDPVRVQALSRHFDQAFIMDLNHLVRLPEAEAVVLADVLEHLAWPRDLLRLVHGALAPDGRVYVSVPNVANITMRLSLLFGRWSYAERGLLDRTHLRFYTRDTIEAELRDNGFELLKVEATTMPIRLALGKRAPAGLIRFLERMLLSVTPIAPSLLGYQWVITAKRV